jgi:hypothetical protein
VRQDVQTLLRKSKDGPGFDMQAARSETAWIQRNARAAWAFLCHIKPLGDAEYQVQLLLLSCHGFRAGHGSASLRLACSSTLCRPEILKSDADADAYLSQSRRN